MTVQTALSSSYEEVGDCRWQTRDGEAKQEQTENSFTEILGKCDLLNPPTHGFEKRVQDVYSW